MRRTFNRQCPHCTRQVTWPETPTYPFCSERCRLIDLAIWASASIVSLGYRWLNRSAGEKVSSLWGMASRAVNPVIIALLTDFGTRDAYVAQLKGAILSLQPTVQLIDLTHAVGAFDVRAAAYLLDASARYFPPETIFVA